MFFLLVDAFCIDTGQFFSNTQRFSDIVSLATFSIYYAKIYYMKFFKVVIILGDKNETFSNNFYYVVNDNKYEMLCV